MSPNPDGTWSEQVLHQFTGGKDGANPAAGLIFDSAGNLYGTTAYGGPFKSGSSGYGVVFKLTPAASGPWTETVIKHFGGGADGRNPWASLIFDSAGNLYGTTQAGGGIGHGTAFRLTPNAGGGWTGTVIHSFENGDGAFPASPLVIDAVGNLYGTALTEACEGLVFELIPNQDGTYTERLIFDFCHYHGGGVESFGGLILDSAGNLYGTALGGAVHRYGLVFELSPSTTGYWPETLLHVFDQTNGESPYAGLIFDSAGNLYGTTRQGGVHGYGVVFELTPSIAGGWTGSLLHAFNNDPASYPWAGLIMDASGNLYGTTFGDDSTTFGTVFEISP